MMVAGFLAGRIGSAVDHEMRMHHQAVSAIPALTLAVEALTKRMEDRMVNLDSRLDERFTDLSQRVGRLEKSDDHLTNRIEALDDRIDSLAAAEGVFISGGREKMRRRQERTAKTGEGTAEAGTMGERSTSAEA